MIADTVIDLESSLMTQFRREARAISLLAAMFVHLVLLLVVMGSFPWFWPIVADRRNKQRDRKTEDRRERKKDRKSLQFVLVDPALDDEQQDPLTADAVGAHSRKAREQAPDKSLPHGPPRSNGILEFLPSLLPRPSPVSIRERSAAAVQVQRPRPEDEQASRTEKSSNLTLERKLPKASPTGELEPPRVEKRRPAVTERRNEPRFRDLRKTRKSTRPRPSMKSLTSARLAGTRSMALLKARYPEYMARVLKLWVQAVNRQKTMSHSSYRSGSVVVRIAIQPDGSIANLKILYAPKNMLAERNMTTASIRDAAPFPPLTPKMQQDPLFKAVTFILMFR